MALVLLSNGGGQVVNPLPGNAMSGPCCLGRCDKRDEVLLAEGRPKPVPVLALTARHDRLVHQVITEHGGAGGAAGRYLLPESGLRCPALLLGELVIPSGDDLLV